MFTPDQICAEVDVEVNADANKPLCIKVSGEEPKEPDGDGNVREIEVIATYEENFSVPRATFRVTCPAGAKVVDTLTGGTMSFSEGPLGTMTSLVISETFRVGGCVVKDRVRTFGYHNPEVWRYQQDATGAPKATYAYNPLPGGVYLFDDAETDGAVGRAFEVGSLLANLRVGDRVRVHRQRVDAEARVRPRLVFDQGGRHGCRWRVLADAQLAAAGPD